MMGTRPKVFGVGFHKTATTSLKRALQALGYQVTGPDARDHPNPGTTALDLCVDLSHRFDAFQDNPWPIFYREMDELHPGSRFILTTRPTDKWIASVVGHFGTGDTPMREWIYGAGHPVGNEAAYVERYERHNAEVIDYFSGRTEQLLVFPIAAGAGWEELCRFLGVPVPPDPFPRANSSGARRQRSRLGARAARNLRRLGGR